MEFLAFKASVSEKEDDNWVMVGYYVMPGRLLKDALHERLTSFWEFINKGRSVNQRDFHEQRYETLILMCISRGGVRPCMDRNNPMH